MNERKRALTNHVFGLVAQHALNRGAVVEEKSIPIQDGNYVERIFDQRAEVFFPPDQFGFCPAALLAFFRLLCCSLDGWNQSLRPMLEHIIGCSALETFDGRLFADRPGDEQKG